MTRTFTWEPGMASLGQAVVAIGVFDGVHLGHQALLGAAVSEARSLRTRSIAITFDRDPDQVVTPEAAAPQLLTLAEKTRYITETGVDGVVVVPFTPEMAQTPPDDFLDQVVAGCCTVAGIHVGRNFRFGAHAAGDLETLYAWGAEHDAEVRPHDLLIVGGEPVSSTRIRALVSHGRVEEATELLGRPTRLTGRVHEGRRQGSKLGFPTANVEPVPYAAVPGDGVYAGRAVLANGTGHPAAISVGVAPSFPDARDYIEAHLIDFRGDLYGEELSLEFLGKLRDQQAFDSLDALTAAIRADVDETRRLFAETGEAEYGSDDEGGPIVEDPWALEAAERAVAGIDPEDAYEQSDEEWVELVGPRRLSGIFGEAGFTAAVVAAPLDAAGIPYVWDPYPPEHMPSFRPYYGVFDRPFSLLVPASRLDEARRAMGLR